jgi:hypothetical protein
VNEQQSTHGRYEGIDWICSNCGCEIMVKHSGDLSKMADDSTYVCRCGTVMELEHKPAATTIL